MWWATYLGFPVRTRPLHRPPPIPSTAKMLPAGRKNCSSDGFIVSGNDSHSLYINIYHLQTVQVHIFIIHILCRNVQSCDKRSHPELAGAESAFIYSRNQGMTLQISDNLTASHIRDKCNMIKSYQILKCKYHMYIIKESITCLILCSNHKGHKVSKEHLPWFAVFSWLLQPVSSNRSRVMVEPAIIWKSNGTSMSISDVKGCSTGWISPFFYPLSSQS